MSEPIDRLNAVLEGRYRIEREIGEGGMATVYLADDLRHERKVALKVLKPELAAVVGAERFLAEIKTTANLQHPHILPLFDSGETDGFLFYVMPYIEGETLRERLDREKQLPVEEAVGIATAVANALQAAHDQNVIHRDIKPANILMSQGEPLVADFGIALAVGAAGGPRLTETGLSVGTPYYMSPEQATGDTAVGPRSDVYALACVLYEMLVGDPPYTGSTAQAVLGKIIMGEPVSATAARASIPPNVDAAIRKSLEKLPADRFGSAQAFARALADPGFRHGAVEASPAASDTGVPSAWRAAALALAATTVLGLAAAVWAWSRPEPPDPVVRSHIDLGALTLNPFEKVTVSGDGSRFAVPADVRGERALYIRNADEERFRRIPGTENAYDPSFSPAGDWIAYLEWPSGTLLRVSVAGGAPRVVSRGDERGRLALHWAHDGTLLFSSVTPAGEGIFRVPETGGDPELVLDGSFTNPWLLPGGRALLATDMERRATVLFDFEADSARVLIPDGVDASYIETGHVLYVDPAGGLWAVEFDPGEGAPEGEPAPLLDRVAVANRWRGHYAVSKNGTLVYRTGDEIGVGGDQQLLVTGLDGNEDVRPLEPRLLGALRWSPDGSSVAFHAPDDSVLHIHTYDVELGTAPRQLTFEGSNARPVWSPDGTRVAFRSSRDSTGDWDLFMKRVDDDTPPEPILSRPGLQTPLDWPAEDMLVFHDANATDLWIVNPADTTSARPYLTGEAFLADLSVSPDASLAAYTSDETGVDEVYVRSFPTPRQPVRVSEGGGRDPRWSPGGDTLYYWRSAAEDTLFAARVRREPTFAVLSTEALLSRDYDWIEWDLHPDGDRFAVPRDVSDGVAEPGGDAERGRVLVVTNWFAELRAALGEH